MPFFRSLPDNANAIHIWPLHPEGYAAWGPLVTAVMRSPSQLSMAEKELIGAYASAMNGCQHCYTAHYPVAVAMGVDSRLFDNVEVDPWDAPIDHKLKPLIAFVRKLCRDPHRLIQADADRVFDAGWNERTLTDAIHITCIFSYMNMLMMGHGADEQDLSVIGPLHTVLRENESYGYGLSHGDLLNKLDEARKRFGRDAVDAAAEAYFGLKYTPDNPDNDSTS